MRRWPQYPYDPQAVEDFFASFLETAMSDFDAAIERAVFIVSLNAGVRKISAFSGTTM
jgi:hypothetical protein